MPILIVSKEFTAEHRREVRIEFDLILEKIDNYDSPEYFKYLIESIVDLKFSRTLVKRQLSYYLLAICTFLDLPKTTRFDRLYEKQLFVAILYFIEPFDVIPDHIPYIGLLDDAFCVNYALTMQSPRVKDEIERIVKKLENT